MLYNIEDLQSSLGELPKNKYIFPTSVIQEFVEGEPRALWVVVVRENMMIDELFFGVGKIWMVREGVCVSYVIKDMDMGLSI